MGWDGSDNLGPLTLFSAVHSVGLLRTSVSGRLLISRDLRLRLIVHSDRNFGRLVGIVILLRSCLSCLPLYLYGDEHIFLLRRCGVITELFAEGRCLLLKLSCLSRKGLEE